MFRRSLFALGLLPFALVACGPVDGLESPDESPGAQEQAVCAAVTTVTFGSMDNFKMQDDSSVDYIQMTLSC